MIRLGLADYFSITVTATDTSEHKPDPAPMLFYLEKAGMLPEQAVYIGDSSYAVSYTHLDVYKRQPIPFPA